MKKLTQAYIKYQTPNGEFQGFKIKTFRGINATNAYTIGYVHHVSRAFNFILGRAAYFSNRTNKGVAEIIVSGKDLAKNIGCHPSHASYVLKSLKDLFGLEFKRRNQTGGARVITINKRMIDFLKIYSEEDFQAFIMMNDMYDHEYILRRLYERRIWEVPDSQLNRVEQTSKKDFLDDPEVKNYHHYTYSSNKSDHKRIESIDKGINKLSSMELDQLDKIKEGIKTGKLEYYLHKVLIKLEQRVSFLLRKVKEVITPNKKQHSQIDRNTTPGTVAHERATAAAVKDPEEPSVISYQELTQFFMVWNSMALEQSMSPVKEITSNRMESINSIVRKTSKGDLFKALNNIKKLYHDNETYQYKMNLKRFTRYGNFMRVLETTKYDTRLSQFESEDVMDQVAQTFNERQHLNSIMNSVPQFNSLSEANTWFKANN
ncbi:MAG: hypothetical protein ACTSU7_00585 [Candidatus Heimdallarchaeaceae archaeon]